MSYRTSIINGQTVAILAKAFYLFQMLLNDDKGGDFSASRFPHKTREDNSPFAAS